MESLALRKRHGDGIEEFQSVLEVAARAEKANVVEKIDGIGKNKPYIYNL